MSRVKRGTKRRRRHNKILALASGYYGRKSTTYRAAAEQVRRALADAYTGRKLRKRNFRRLWIVRINAAARLHGLRYSELIHLLNKSGIQLDRKVLANIAVTDPEGFARIVETAKKAL
jgi:large subunit ribosomal protein L20